MERSDLDLRLSIFEGGTARVDHLVLFVHLRAAAGDPPRSTAEFLVLCRDDSGCAPPWITKSAVTDQEVARLVRLLRAAGFPKRAPRVVASQGPLGGGQHVALEVRLDGRHRALNLALEYAGFSGDDAEPTRAALRRLGELAEAGGRPAVRAVLDGLAHDRSGRAGPERPRAGLALGGRIVGRGRAAEAPAAPALRTDSRGSLPDTTPPARWEFPAGC